MSYGAASALQAAVFAALSGDAAVTNLVGNAIFDAMPSGQPPALYVTLGAELARDRSDMTGGGALHEFNVTVVTDTAGFSTAKDVAGAISDALVDANLTLSRGTLVSLRFDKARAQRVSGGAQRQIILTFKARIDDA